MLIHPQSMPATQQFDISIAVSLAICEALGRHIDDLSIKWPNDIYWRNGKIAGILIEHTLQGIVIKKSIIGVGLNVNPCVVRHCQDSLLSACSSRWDIPNRRNAFRVV